MLKVADTEFKILNLHSQGNFLSCHGRRLPQICLSGTIPTICSSLTTFQDTRDSETELRKYTTAVVKYMKSIFARHGIPQEIVSDNGPQYSSREFAQFAKQYGFVHNTSSPKYPQSNGETERGVRTIKVATP